MQFPFAKYHGAGNDFIIIDDDELKFPWTDVDYIAHLCQHRLGVGADGLILLQPSKKAGFRMRIFNADGKEAAQCGNGLRCLVDFIRHSKRVSSPLRVETEERVIACSWEGDQITVDLGAPAWLFKHTVDSYPLQVINTGVPHAVTFVENLEMPDFKSIASKLRHNAIFAPEGTNVNFASLQGDKIYTRTYERGVEDETLACGTGAAAVAIAAIEEYKLKSPICIVPASQEELFVEVDSKTVRLRGKATFVFHGIVSYSSWKVLQFPL
jgi:diaminopimelate epimerase